ncbi:MAG TPA: ThuA domain-containing protein [Verrucomicrobiae bacterium]|jgi:hypothetical protein|nr:ThuA domain-containing protein [Verrucomicrobiae bacterium]
MTSARCRFLISLAMAWLALHASAQIPRVRVLVLSRQPERAAFLQKVLQDANRFDVRLCECPDGLSAEMLRSFDVVVDDAACASDPAVDTFVKSGKGLVSVAAAADGLPQFLRITIAQTNHPMVAGITPEFRIADVLAQVSAPPGATVLADINGAPALAVSTNGQGRVVSLLLGRNFAALHERFYLAVLARGVEWAATDAVTLPAEISLSEPDPHSLRALLITGGHEHETSFYSLFDGYKDIGRVEDSSSDVAFKYDLRQQYDVLIMYDFSRDLDEASRRHLRDFVESGKGVLVLHHAILSYQKWPWWFEEVVGGRYRLDRDGDIPASSVKANREFFVTPVSDHPITAGLGPFHLWDETYKGMWISPRIKPLLTTDNPDSDPCIAWIGPCATSRVVYIQLGHGHTAFQHPVYRALVHRALLWVAGRELSTP